MCLGWVIGVACPGIMPRIRVRSERDGGKSAVGNGTSGQAGSVRHSSYPKSCGGGNESAPTTGGSRATVIAAAGLAVAWAWWQSKRESADALAMDAELTGEAKAAEGK